jgi:hypothetical protein
MIFHFGLGSGNWIRIIFNDSEKKFLSISSQKGLMLWTISDAQCETNKKHYPIIAGVDDIDL